MACLNPPVRHQYMRLRTKLRESPTRKEYTIRTHSNYCLAPARLPYATAEPSFVHALLHQPIHLQHVWYTSTWHHSPRPKILDDGQTQSRASHSAKTNNSGTNRQTGHVDDMPRALPFHLTKIKTSIKHSLKNDMLTSPLLLHLFPSFRKHPQTMLVFPSFTFGTSWWEPSEL